MTKGDLVAEGVGERLDRVVRREAVPREVECGVQLGELEGPGSGEHAECRPTERASVQPLRPGGYRRQRRPVVHRGAAPVAAGEPGVERLAEVSERGDRLATGGGDGLGVIVELVEPSQETVALDLEFQPAGAGKPAGDPHLAHLEVVAAAAPRADGHLVSSGSDCPGRATVDVGMAVEGTGRARSEAAPRGRLPQDGDPP